MTVPTSGKKPDSPIRGLYAIADTALLGDRLLAAVEAALAGGAHAIQYRDKSDDPARRERQAADLAVLCRAHGAALIINDDVALAVRVAAQGVHLGRDDPAVAAARVALGNQALIGVSCYNQLDRAMQAQAAGADYVAFGSFYPSTIKPDAVRAGRELLEQARAMLQLPVVAIGGITADNAGPLIRAGADAVAVISDLFATPNIQAAARRYVALFRSAAR